MFLIMETRYVIPSHSNRMAMAILCTIFCCLIGGIVAIVKAAESNKLYSSAIYAADDTIKQSLFMQSEEKNRQARAWIIASIVVGVLSSLFSLALFVFGAAGTFASASFS